ncbi:TauD/TfdA family dioxygenase [Hydrogenophaga sp. BPS33]|nr:TauD/TfdA family dioxygenase [Hydrogenophaga sp. BPS33]
MSAAPGHPKQARTAGEAEGTPMSTTTDTTARAEAPALKIRPLMPGFGVEVLDVDILNADAATLSALENAVGRHGAILLRGQHLIPTEQLEFTRAFGEPAPNPRRQYVVPDMPEIYVISNRMVDGKFIGEAEAGTAWHTDLNTAPWATTCWPNTP